MSLYTDIFQNLVKIGIIDERGQLTFNESIKLESSGFMPFHCEYIMKRGENDAYMIAMAHYGELNGDLMADPNMRVIIEPVTKQAFAITFQNDYVGAYQTAANDNEVLDMSMFLKTWTENLIHQGFVY